jgi:small-conductance mechanosensitive channel
MERLNAAEAERNDLSKKNAAMAADLERLRQRQQADQSELVELRKQLRQARIDAEAAEKRVATAVAEMKRSNQQVAQSGAAVEQREAEVREELGRTIQRLQGDVERQAKETTAWQQRYDTQLAENRTLSDKALAADRRSDEMKAEKEAMERRLADCHKAVDAILSRIDWPHVGAAMKMSPTVKRNFNSLLKRLDYDEDRNLTIEGTLGVFWAALSAKENALIEAIAKSTENEIINGSIKDYWANLAEMFPDVQTSLEARIAMLSILQDIFYQSYTDEDLQTPTVVPKTTKKTKKADE